MDRSAWLNGHVARTVSAETAAVVTGVSKIRSPAQRVANEMEQDAPLPLSHNHVDGTSFMRAHVYAITGLDRHPCLTVHANRMPVLLLV